MGVPSPTELEEKPPSVTDSGFVSGEDELNVKSDADNKDEEVFDPYDTSKVIHRKIGEIGLAARDEIPIATAKHYL